jgi:3-demethoxyubiquinol 3-hydroxylase
MSDLPQMREAVTTGNPCSTAAGSAITVLYDGACPLCRREIAVYQNAQANEPLCFVDVASADVALPDATPRPQLLARFHVIDRSGQLVSGAEAFIVLWSALPGWRWLARLERVPGAVWAMEQLYRLFLHWRPGLQRWFRKRGDPTGDQR